MLSADEERSMGAAPDATLPTSAEAEDAGSGQPAEENLTDAPAGKPGEVSAPPAEAP